MALACCAALGGFTVPAADRGFVCSAQHEEVTALSTLLIAGFGRLSNLILLRRAGAAKTSV
jgi:hypothetical protein|tara:strand:- start:132 stop:314 length:183 start_codon:yes stop_codon:yes gene_type:complete